MLYLYTNNIKPIVTQLAVIVGIPGNLDYQVVGGLLAKSIV